MYDVNMTPLKGAVYLLDCGAKLRSSCFLYAGGLRASGSIVWAIIVSIAPSKTAYNGVQHHTTAYNGVHSYIRTFVHSYIRTTTYNGVHSYIRTFVQSYIRTTTYNGVQRTYGRTDGRTDNGRMDDGRTDDGRTDGRTTDGRTERQNKKTKKTMF